MSPTLEKPQEIGERNFIFVLQVIKLLKLLPSNPTNQILIKQLIRSVTSIGANIEEAQGAHTKSDFSHCMNIAKKEALETRYWLKLLLELNPTSSSKFSDFLKENEEIIKILVTIVKKSNLRKF